MRSGGSRPFIRVAGGNVLDAGVIFRFQTVIFEVLETDNAETILTTAKGCSKAPQRAKGSFHHNQATFYGFLRKLGETNCLGSYMEVAWGWVIQVVRRNPNSFPSGHPVHGVINRVRDAELAKLRELGKANPRTDF